MSATDPPSDEQLLLQFLHDRDVPCPLCKYNLRNLTSPRCPECGRAVQLGVGLTEPFLRAWIALAFVSFATAGIGLIVDVITAFEGFNHREPVATTIAVGYLMISPLGALAVVLLRRQILRLSRSVQWGIAAGAMVVSIGVILIITMS